MKEEKEEVEALFPTSQSSLPEPALNVSPNLLLQLLPMKLQRSTAVRDYPDGCVRRRITTLVIHKEICDGIQDKPDTNGKDLDLINQNAIPLSHYPNDIDFLAPLLTSATSQSPCTRKTKKKGNYRKRSFDVSASKLDISHVKNPINLCTTLVPYVHNYDARSLVIKTLRIYDAVRRSLLLEEDLKFNRPDLYAGTALIKHGLSINRNTAKLVGEFPGVEIGDVFFFRMELCCIGMHGPVQGGIAYGHPENSIYDRAIALSIISSGGYSAQDSGDVLIYTGQGGKPRQDGKQPEDQKLERGNLAMECSYRNKVPVRVIRGIKDLNSPSGKTYTYDGLYQVDKVWSEKNNLGFKEFKFKLNRLPGQPELGSAMIKLSSKLKLEPHSREGLRIHDISGGKEALPVCVVNTVDDEERPLPFIYSTSMHDVCEPALKLWHLQATNSKSICGSMKSCICLRKNGNKASYLTTGLLVKEKTIIYECGKTCKCSLSCVNRVTQNPSKFRFEVFKTEDKRWGLRSQDVIPSGSFVCEYIGELVDDNHPLKSQDYYLDLGKITDKDAPKWGDVPAHIVVKKNSMHVDGEEDDEEPGTAFTLDSTEIGNMARFINHSCSPNLLVQRVIWDHHRAEWPPHVMLFAMDNIAPFRELTLNYGHTLS